MTTINQIDFPFNIRTEFAFIVSANTLNCILDALVADPENRINIAGYLQTQIKSKRHKKKRTKVRYLVRMVVGPPEAADPLQDLGLIRILRDLGVCFRTNSVIQLTGFCPGTPGVVRSLYGALFCRKQLDVKAIYYGEAVVSGECPTDCSLTIFINVQGDLLCALEILRNREENQCPLVGCC